MPVEQKIALNKESDVTGIAQKRIERIQQAAATLFAKSLAISLQSPQDLSEQLWGAQNKFFDQFERAIPIEIQTNTSIQIYQNLKPKQLLIIANHPPFEKTVSPTENQFRTTLHKIGQDNIIPHLDNMKNLPAGIARRAIINHVMRTMFPKEKFRYHVVGARYRPPLNAIQEVDGTIIVPYADKNHHGFNMLLDGLRKVYTDQSDAAHNHIAVTFPEGEQPYVIENLKPFHRGIFVSCRQLIDEGIPITILPIVMTVQSDFSIITRILEPINDTNLTTESINLDTLAFSLQQKYQNIYSDMLQSAQGGYYWHGMTYPFGGISRTDILSIPKT